MGWAYVKTYLNHEILLGGNSQCVSNWSIIFKQTTDQKIIAQGLEANAERNLFSYSLLLPICPRGLLCLWQLEDFHSSCRIYVQAPQRSPIQKKSLCSTRSGLGTAEENCYTGSTEVGKNLPPPPHRPISGFAEDWWKIKNLMDQ